MTDQGRRQVVHLGSPRHWLPHGSRPSLTFFPLAIPADPGPPQIDCTSDESMTDANRPAHQFTFRPVLQNQRLWPAPVPAAPQSCLAAGKYKLLSLTNGFVRVTGPGLPIRTQMTRDFPGWTPVGLVFPPLLSFGLGADDG